MDMKDKAVNDILVGYVVENANLKIRVRELEYELESIKKEEVPKEPVKPVD